MQALCKDAHNHLEFSFRFSANSRESRHPVTPKEHALLLLLGAWRSDWSVDMDKGGCHFVWKDVRLRLIFFVWVWVDRALEHGWSSQKTLIEDQLVSPSTLYKVCSGDSI